MRTDQPYRAFLQWQIQAGHSKLDLSDLGGWVAQMRNKAGGGVRG